MHEMADFGQETGLKIADFLLRGRVGKGIHENKIEKNDDGRGGIFDNKALIIIIFGATFKTNC